MTEVRPPEAIKHWPNFSTHSFARIELRLLKYRLLYVWVHIRDWTFLAFKMMSKTEFLILLCLKFEIWSFNGRIHSWTRTKSNFRTWSRLLKPQTCPSILLCSLVLYVHNLLTEIASTSLVCDDFRVSHCYFSRHFLFFSNWSSFKSVFNFGFSVLDFYLEEWIRFLCPKDK